MPNNAQLAEDSKDEEKSLFITIPKGSSRREALGLVHHAAALFSKTINLENAVAHEKVCKVKCSRSAYWNAVNNYTDPKADQDDLELEDGQRKVMNMEAVVSCAEKAYADVLSRVRAKADREKKDADKVNADKLIAEKALIEADPATCLRDLIQQEIRRDGMNVDDDDTKEQESDLLSRTISALKGQKNGGSPAAGQGHSKGKGYNNIKKVTKPVTTSGKGKSKPSLAKGTGKGISKKTSASPVALVNKGKDKGKSQPKPKGKGKSKSQGKGKGKGKTPKGAGKGAPGKGKGKKQQKGGGKSGGKAFKQ